MSIAWFDAFREHGAPTWYGENPTPVRLDLGLAVILWLFLTPTLAFLLILPGIRRFRAQSASTFLFSMAVGATLALSMHYPAWNCGQLRVFTAFRAHSRQRVSASLGVNIGLTNVNITLSNEPEETFLANQPIAPAREQAIPAVVDSDIDLLLFGTKPLLLDGAQQKGRNGTKDGGKGRRPVPVLRPVEMDEGINGDAATTAPMFYNERFELNDVSGMEVREVLQKGLPFPILRVVEYFSVDRTGFLWGKQYRLAGYYTMAALWLAFGLWLLQMLLLCVLPHRFGQVVLLCGLSTLAADFLYAWYAPELVVVFPGPDELPHRLHFHLSACFYATLGAGLASTFVGSLLWLLEARSSFRLDTFFSAYMDRMCRPRPPLGSGSSARRSVWATRRSCSQRMLPRSISFTSQKNQSVGWKRRKRTTLKWAHPVLTMRVDSLLQLDDHSCCSRHSPPPGQIDLLELDQQDSSSSNGSSSCCSPPSSPPLPEGSGRNESAAPLHSQQISTASAASSSCASTSTRPLELSSDSSCIPSAASSADWTAGGRELLKEGGEESQQKQQKEKEEKEQRVR